MSEPPAQERGSSSLDDAGGVIKYALIGAGLGAILSIFTRSQKSSSDQTLTLSFRPLFFVHDKRVTERFLFLQQYERFSPEHYKHAGLCCDHVVEIHVQLQEGKRDRSIPYRAVAKQSSVDAMSHLEDLKYDVLMKTPPEQAQTLRQRLQNVLMAIRDILTDHVQAIEAFYALADKEKGSVAGAAVAAGGSGSRREDYLVRRPQRALMRDQHESYSDGYDSGYDSASNYR